MRGRVTKGAVAIVTLSMALALVLSDCGGSSTSTGGSTNGESASQEKSSPWQGKLVQVEGGKSLSREDCVALKQALSREAGESVEAAPRPKPERFSECQLRTKNGLVVVYIDSTVPVRGRYLSRVNGIRKGAKNAETRLHPVNGLGEGLDGEKGAYWLPSISSLYSYQADGWLTLLYTLENQSNAEKRAGAEALAERTFELTEQE